MLQNIETEASHIKFVFEGIFTHKGCVSPNSSRVISLINFIFVEIILREPGKIVIYFSGTWVKGKKKSKMLYYTLCSDGHN